MRCTHCGHENKEVAKFCNECGAKLELACATCMTVNPPGSKFCHECGAALISKAKGKGQKANRATHPQPPISYTPVHLAERIRAATFVEGERKTITALFADLKGSTALIEGLDPEEAQALIDPALQLMMDAVHQYEGYVAQPLGDGVFALFGAPIAHEDHPQRALYAALRMQEEMRRYADALRQKGSPPLLLRVGLNTGEVVLRSIRKDDLHADYVPVGHSTNLAARMEQLAPPGSIVVSAYTHRLTDGYFAFKELGPTQIKGVTESLNIYEVLGTSPLRTRLQVAARRGLTWFIGRQSELEQLHQALDQTKAGHGQIVGTMGEPGLGKSRLFHEFKLLSLSGCLVLEADAVSYGKATAYLPVIELLKSYFQIQPQDDERTRRERVIGKVLGLDRTLEDTLPYLFALLGFEEQPSPLQQMDPQIRRRRTFDALKKLFLRESLNQAVILIFEDLHWIDNETQGFLDTLSESVASAKILLLTNYRPEYRHGWGSKTYYTQLRLAPLGQAEAEEFLDALLGTEVGAARRGRPTEVALQQLKHIILDKTQGTPFFMEEIVQDLFEQGVLVRTEGGAVQRLVLSVPKEDRPWVGADRRVGPQSLHIPPTVQAVLAARIDRLALDEKALLQQLAVIGREFPLSLAKQVVAQPEADLYRLLGALQHKEFLYEQPALPEPDYIFKHALTQEVAYGSVLIERRKVLHEQTGQALEQLYKDNLEEHYSELAHHYRHSSNTEKAIAYLHKAGQQAVQRSANEEAITHLTAALELLKTLPETTERDRQELALQVSVSQVLRAVKGTAAMEVEKLYLRIRDLCQQLGETVQFFRALWGLRGVYLARAEMQATRQFAEQCLAIATEVGDPALLASSHIGMGQALLWAGDMPLARAHYEQGITFCDPRQLHTHIGLYGQAIELFARVLVAFNLRLLGFPDRAKENMVDTLRIAHELAHPYTLAAVLYWNVQLAQVRREPQEVLNYAETLIGLSQEHGFPQWLAMNVCVQGWGLCEQGEESIGIERIREGIVSYQATGGEILRTYYQMLLAERLGRTGEVDNGLSLLTDALATIEKTDERWHEAELYRLKGELLLAQARKLRDGIIG